MKMGVSVILSHTTFLAVGIVALMVILISVFNVSTDIREQSLKAQLTFVAETLKSEILNLYELSEHSDLLPDEGETLLIEEIKPNIPEKISEKRYTIKFSPGNVTVRTNIQNQIVEINRSINVIITLNGTAITPAVLKLERSNIGGIISNEIRLVE